MLFRSKRDLESGSEKRLGLLDQALPEPSDPHYSPVRILSTSVVLLFLIVAVYNSIAASFDSTSSELRETMWENAWRRMSWIDGPAVSMGNASPAETVSEDVAAVEESSETDLPLVGDLAGELSNSSDSPLLDIEAEDGMNPQLLDDEDLPHITAKPDLGRYLWHADLKFKSAGSGRLIVVGDVHGMADSLKCVRVDSPD